MLQSLMTSPWTFLVGVFALLAAITIHEFSHAWMAERLGDPTARLMGRLTLNPLAHLDPIGTIAILLVGFGWGKPVPFDPFNLANPKRDSALISLAGPASNLILAVILSVIIRILSPFTADSLFILIARPVVYLCVVLAFFNLIPIHPLDGGKILMGLLPDDLAARWDAVLNQYGLFLLILLVFPFAGGSLVGYILGPIVSTTLGILLPGGAFF